MSKEYTTRKSGRTGNWMVVRNAGTWAEQIVKVCASREEARNAANFRNK